MPKVLDLPEVYVGRCKFNRQFRNITTFNVGDVIPLMYDCNITPGDDIQLPIKALIRMQTPLYPVMDDLVFDVSAWFVPDRITWKHFVNFWGENDTTFWEQPTTYEIPQIEAPSGGWAEGSLADYFGIPTKVGNISVSHMPFRAYARIWNDFWRDENLKEPIFVNDDETTLTGKNKDSNYDYTTYTQLGAAPAKAAKRADYFTKSLPAPQKSEDIFVPLGGTAPVIGTGMALGLTDGTNKAGLYSNTDSINLNAKRNSYGKNVGSTDSTTTGLSTAIGVTDDPEKSGLAADLTKALGITVQQLRLCVSLQRYAETIARSGSRYIEVLAGVFGTKSSDARLQRAEFLGGKSFPISMSQVLATTKATNQNIGNVGGMSQTIINDYLCTKGFEEHGTLMVLGVLRVKRHTYQNGIPRMLTRKSQMDFYNRALDHIGEQIVRNDEIYAQGSTAINSDTGKPYDEEAFGYQPAFEDMRLGRTYVTGEMRSNATTPLDAWHYADNYNALPVLSSEWIDEDKTNVDRTLTINSSVSNQVFGDFVFDMAHTRGMSMYGTPGFMDHM